MEPSSQASTPRERIPLEELQRIRGAANIEAAARFYGITLRQQDDELVGTAPFSKHEDAFLVSVSKQCWFDRSLDRSAPDDHGRSKMLVDGKPVSADVFGLVMALGRLTFPKAVSLVKEKFTRP